MRPWRISIQAEYDRSAPTPGYRRRCVLTSVDHTPLGYRGVKQPLGKRPPAIPLAKSLFYDRRPVLDDRPRYEIPRMWCNKF